MATDDQNMKSLANHIGPVQMMSISETAALFSVSESTIRRMINRRVIPVVRVNESWRIERAAALAAVEHQARLKLGE